MDFNTAFDRLMVNEGGYSNNPADPGGETMWGVTKNVALANGYTGAMVDLPKSFAASIYKDKYWMAVRADELPPEIRFDVFDAAVNSGPVQSIKWLQRCLGVADDGVLGPKTLSAATVYNGAALSKKFNAQRLRFMTNLNTWSSFGKGWARRIADNMEA